MTTDETIEIKKEKKQDVLIVSFTGRFDAITSDDIERELLNCIDRGEKKLLLDFSNVNYISSAGMRVLLAVAKKLRSVSGKLVLCSINSRVQDVLKMSGFEQVMDLEINENDALNKFR